MYGSQASSALLKFTFWWSFMTNIFTICKIYFLPYICLGYDISISACGNWLWFAIFITFIQKMTTWETENLADTQSCGTKKFMQIVCSSQFRAHFLSLAPSKLRLCSANHRAGYWSNLPCDWLSIAWAYFKQETENGPRTVVMICTTFWTNHFGCELQKNT